MVWCVLQVDQVVQGRVLNVDAGARKLSLTLKPALLNSKLPLITSPSALPPPHAYAHGVVTGVTVRAAAILPPPPLRGVASTPLHPCCCGIAWSTRGRPSCCALPSPGPSSFPAQDFGVYVTFYGGVAGLAHASELKDAGAKPSEAHHVGQVVRARVLSHEPLTGRLKLSLRPPNAAAQDVAAQQKQARLDPLQGLQPGELVHGRVVRLEEPPAGGKPHGPALVLEVWAGEEAPAEGAEGPGAAAPARLELPGHLADHPAAMAALQPLVAKPGTWLGEWRLAGCAPLRHPLGRLACVHGARSGAALSLEPWREGSARAVLFMCARSGPLVVLERLEGQRTLRVSRKASLVAAARAKRWPTTFEQVRRSAKAPPSPPWNLAAKLDASERRGAHHFFNGAPGAWCAAGAGGRAGGGLRGQRDVGRRLRAPGRARHGCGTDAGSHIHAGPAASGSRPREPWWTISTADHVCACVRARSGRAGLSQLADTFVSDPHLLFSEGQSVRAQVVTVDAAKQRFSVTLRPSLTASTDASYLASLYR